MTKMKKTIKVDLKNNRGYPIIIEPGALDTLGPELSKYQCGKKTLIITHPEINTHYGRVAYQSLTDTGFETQIIEIPSGEESKTLAMISKLIDTLIAQKLERNDTIIALGGGVIGDLTGFAAAIYLRGINLVQVPTSLLAQVDAAIGGKTGVNHNQGKNLIGSFHQPKFVLIDPTVLKTLDKRELLSGLAEVVKYAIIRDKPLFWFIEQHIDEIITLNPIAHPETWNHLIERSAENKAEIVSQDETEKNIRETLNLGHTTGHAIETAATYGTYKHGEAIAMGTKVAAEIATARNLLDTSDKVRIIDLLTKLGFTHTIPQSLIPEILTHLHTDKKIKSGELRFILPTEIADTKTITGITEEEVKSALSIITTDE